MKVIGISGVVFLASFAAASAAPLPAPAKLCPAIAATADEGNTKIPQWQKSGAEYFCRSDGMQALGAGVVFMDTYQASGPSQSSANGLFFEIKMYDSQLEKDVLSKLILPRLSAIFAAANAGPVPDDLANAINSASTASVATPFGTIQTTYTPGKETNPNNGAVFDLELKGAPSAAAQKREADIALCTATPDGQNNDQIIASCTVLLKSTSESVAFLAAGHNNRARAYYGKGLVDKAIADFTKAIALAPTSAQPYENRAIAYEKKGAKDKAMADYRAVLKIEPDNQPAIDAIKRLGGS